MTNLGITDDGGHSMKKLILPLMIVLSLVLSSCSNLASSNVETLKGWSFQYNEGTNDYSVFFALLNKADQYVSANVDVDIRIEDESGTVLYSTTKSVTDDNFGYYTSQAAGEQYLAEIRIPEDEIAAGQSTSGTVYLTVYKDDSIRFDEVNCSALYCLPLLDVNLVAEQLPVEVNVNSYFGLESTMQIEEVSFEYEDNFSPLMRITVSGTKIYGESNSGYDIISYKILDSDGYVVDASQVFIYSLSQGDKFRDDSIVIYDVVPGETYTISFSGYDF